jgi:hypothetical protein
MSSPMKDQQIPEGLVRFTHALVEDAPLRTWFFGLEGLPISLRATAFSQMAQQMRSEKADPELAAALSALVRPELYDAILASVRGRCALP